MTIMLGDRTFPNNIYADGSINSTTGSIFLVPADLTVEVSGIVICSGLHINGQAHNTIPATMAPAGTTQTIDWDNGNVQVIDLEDASGDVTLTFSNAVAGGSYILKVIQDSAVARNIVWPATVYWPDGVTPVISTGANALDIASFLYDGTNYFGNIGQNYYV